MISIELSIVLILNIVVSFAACIPMGITCIKQKNLRIWFFVVIFLAIANLISFFQFGNYTLQVITSLFFALATIFVVVAVFKDYYEMFLKSNHQNLSVKEKFAVAALAVTPLLIGIEIFIFLILLISIFMLFRIYLNTHSSTKFFLLLTAIAGSLCALASLLQYVELEGSYFFSCVLILFFTTLLLATGFVDILEQKIIESTNEKNEIKDIYSHDLGNILQTIYTTIEFFQIKTNLTDKESLNLYELLNNKLIDAKTLIYEIRKL